MKFGGSIELNIDRLVAESSFTSTFSSTRKVTVIGSTIYWDATNNRWVIPQVPEYNEPIAVTIVPIVQFLSRSYTSDQAVLSRYSNLYSALSDYPSYRRAIAPPNDGPLTMPVVWPGGTYGLVQPSGGCPVDGNSRWYTGWRYHDTEDSGSSNAWSSPQHEMAVLYKSVKR